MKMPVPIMVPTEKAQHCQKPMTFAVGAAGPTGSEVSDIEFPTPIPSQTDTPIRNCQSYCARRAAGLYFRGVTHCAPGCHPLFFGRLAARCCGDILGPPSCCAGVRRAALSPASG